MIYHSFNANQRKEQYIILAYQIFNVANFLL